MQNCYGPEITFFSLSNASPSLLSIYPLKIPFLAQAWKNRGLLLNSFIPIIDLVRISKPWLWLSIELFTLFYFVQKQWWSDDSESSIWVSFSFQIRLSEHRSFVVNFIRLIVVLCGYCINFKLDILVIWLRSKSIGGDLNMQKDLYVIFCKLDLFSIFLSVNSDLTMITSVSKLTELKQLHE